MQPSIPFWQNPRFQKLAVLVCLVVFLLLAVYSIFSALTFRLTETNPGLSSVSINSPYIKVSFNKPLKKGSLSYTTSENFVTSTAIDGKTLTFKLNLQLQTDEKYSITIKHIESTGGKIIQNKVLAFTAQNIPTDDLSKDQREALMAEQDKYVYSVNAIYFDNFSYLTNVGLTASQEQDVKNGIFGYSKSINKQFKKVVLNTDSMHVGAPGSDESWVEFTATIDGTPYTLHTTYSGFDSAYTIVSNASGQEVYRDTPEVIDDNGE